MLTKLFLVDYDIPVEMRHKFYYSLRMEIIQLVLNNIEDNVKKYRKFRELKRKSLRQMLEEIEYTKSTQSVILTTSEKLAKIVHLTAAQFGKSNLYEVRRIA